MADSGHGARDMTHLPSVYVPTQYRECEPVLQTYLRRTRPLREITRPSSTLVVNPKINPSSDPITFPPHASAPDFTQTRHGQFRLPLPLPTTLPHSDTRQLKCCLLIPKLRLRAFAQHGIPLNLKVQFIHHHRSDLATDEPRHKINLTILIKSFRVLKRLLSTLLYHYVLCFNQIGSYIAQRGLSNGER